MLLSGLAALAAVILWSAIPAVVKIGSQSTDWSSILMLRFSVSALVFAPVIYRARGRIVGLVRREPAFALALLAVLGLNFTLQTQAMLGLEVGMYTLIFSLNPILALFVVGGRVSRLSWAGAAVSMAGSLLFVGAVHVGIASWISLTLLFGGMLTWISYTKLLSGLQARGWSDLEATGATQLFALLGIAPVWLVRGAPGVVLDVRLGAAVVLLGIGIPMAFYLFAVALRRAAAFAVTSQYLEPVIGVALGVLLLGERVLAPQLAGCALVLAGLVLSGWSELSRALEGSRV